MIRSLSIIAAITLSACATYQERGKTVVISNHPGGVIPQEQDRFSYYKFRGFRVELKGKIVSAGTIWLGYPNLCIHRGAVFGFHGAHGGFGIQYSDPAKKFAVDNEMGKYYPPHVRSEYNRKWRHSHKLTFVTAEELRGMMSFEWCRK